MATKSYEELMKELRQNEGVEVDYENIPDERPGYRLPPIPGSYRFKGPAAIAFSDPIHIAKKGPDGAVILGPDGKPATNEYINVFFDDAHPLVIVQSPGAAYDGEPFTTKISNVPRKRFVGKNTSYMVSDLTYLLRAIDPNARPKLNVEFTRLAAQLLPNREWGANIVWSGYCNPERDAYFAFQGENGETIYEPMAVAEGSNEAKKGCGKRIYANKWPKGPDGGAAERAQCECGAQVLPYANLEMFKA